ncbi:amino acid permease [Flavonifractor sp. An92]|uniref:APC family permease n=1 Tax=Flavonifractor sp. An92 TaxID=1965666 RepID=UPI000B3839B2|nr:MULTISPECIES: APC family permease [unclassified Flavonifractor]OUN07345.1 amino acid permease [Flavonifractor sp. An92]OUQ23384.1 amino acid permease [Flavonifractor sp. An135]
MEQPNKKPAEKNSIRRVLGPIHVWALGVGIVLVGEFMGWNLTIKQGGSIAALLGLWVMSMMYVGQVMMVSEMATVMPEAGGQYTMAKYLLGPLAAFNVGLMLVFEYAMLEAGDVIVVGQLLNSLNPDIQILPFTILTLLVLAFINYRGAQATLTLNFVITAVAFTCVIVLLISTNFYDPQATLIQLKELTNGLPYGPLGIMAAIGYSCWFFLGIEGTAMAADECRSPARSIPLGAIVGLSTLLIGGTITWFVCSGLIPAGELGPSVYPLYDAALATGKLFVAIALFVGSILACLASANGCINDASNAWAALSRDTLLPNVFAKEHPKYKSHYRAIIFLLPISLAFAMTGLLDQVVTFSIFSALMVYLLTCVMMYRFRKMYPLGTVKRSFVAPLFPLLPAVVAVIVVCGLFGLHLNYGINLISGAVFYLLASIWFLKRRAKFIDQDRFLEAGLKQWGKPKWM